MNGRTSKKIIRIKDSELVKMEKWLKWAIEIQSLAQAGLTYTKDIYDKERYNRLREISAEMIEEKSNVSKEKVKDLFCNETGYQTPKIDTRAVIFKNNKILLTHENNGTWALPGGWCDVLESVKSNTIKEVKEEIAIIEEYLPKQLTKEEILPIIQEIINKTGASSIKDMGKVMGEAKKQLGVSADGKTISECVKELLSK